MTKLQSYFSRLRLLSLTAKNQFKVRGGAKKWDDRAIDQVYEELIDNVGLVLDKIQVLGFRPLFDGIKPFRYFRRLCECMEKELLIQWTLKREKNLAAVFDRQQKWLCMELRSLNGFFPIWNKFYRGVLDACQDPENHLHRDPWKSLVLKTLTDSEAMSELKLALASSKKEQLAGEICSLFEILFNLSPHHMATSFLNLNELGSGSRPEIPDPGEFSVQPDERQPITPAQKMLAPVLSHNNWTDMPERLLEFWKTTSG